MNATENTYPVGECVLIQLRERHWTPATVTGHHRAKRIGGSYVEFRVYDGANFYWVKESKIKLRWRVLKEFPGCSEADR